MSAWGILLHFLGLGICLLGLTWRKQRLVAGTIVAIGGFLVGTSPFWLAPYLPQTPPEVPVSSEAPVSSERQDRQATQGHQEGKEASQTTSTQDSSISLEALDAALEQASEPKDNSSQHQSSQHHSSQHHSSQDEP